MDYVIFDLPLYVYVILAVTAMLSSIVQFSTGLGYAVVYMAIIPYFLEYKTVLAVMFVLYLVLSFYTVFTGWKKVNFKMSLPCIIGNATGLGFGFLMLNLIKTEYITKLLGALLLSMAIYFLLLKNKWRVKPTFTKGIALGNLSGFLGGMFGIGGPPLSIYLLNSTDDIYEYLVNIQLSYGIGTILSVIMHAADGRYTPSANGIIVVSLIPVVAGCIMGRMLLKKVDKDKFNKILYIFMAIMGLILLFK